MDISLIVQVFSVIITFFSVTLLYLTIKNNKNLNQNNIFNEVVKQERELRVKLNEYRGEINKRLDSKKDIIEVTLNYDTLLFNYYEYLAICLYKNIINEKAAKLYFKDLLSYVKEVFESSILFKEKYADKNQYKGIQWLFKKWDIELNN